MQNSEIRILVNSEKEAFRNRIKVLKEELNRNPNNVDVAVQLGNLYYDHGDPCYAIVYYQHALSLNNNMPGVKTDLGTMFWKNGDLALAECAFRDVIRSHPEFANAYINLGSLLLRGKHQVKEAQAIWSELINRFPEHPATQRARQLIRNANQ